LENTDKEIEMKMFSRSIQLTLVLLAMCCVARVDATELEHTHKQTRMFQPKQAGTSTKLNTFCLDDEGNILACTSSTKKRLIEVYSPEFKLLREIELPFAATAINVAADGKIYAGGSGKIAVISSAGEILSQHVSPQIGDEATAKKRLEEIAKERTKLALEGYKKQIERIDVMIEKLKGEEELSKRDQKRLDTYGRQKAIIQSNMEQYDKQAVIDPAAILASARIRSIAVTSKALFVCCNSLEGRGYEVWKCNLDVSEPVLLTSGLSGCCGQFDIQANEDYLFLAENTKFQVGLMDHDGKRISSFGKSNRMGGDGFGSCCNPMNVRCCENGDILTAESSIGTIKRFNPAGELIGIVGKGKIGGGCKHVALGFDKARDRYYIQYEDKNGICVLENKSITVELTAEAIAAKKAADELGTQLVGMWSTTGKAPVSKTSNFIAIGSAQPVLTTVVNFSDDGTMSGAVQNQKWAAISAEDKSLMIEIDVNEQTADWKVEFTNENQITISMIVDGEVAAKKRYKRVVEEKATEKPSEASSDAGGQ
jgi:hypothetical protein